MTMDLKTLAYSMTRFVLERYRIRSGMQVAPARMIERYRYDPYARKLEVVGLLREDDQMISGCRLRSGLQVAEDLRFRTSALFQVGRSHPARFWACNLLEQSEGELPSAGLCVQDYPYELGALACSICLLFCRAIAGRAIAYLRARWCRLGRLCRRPMARQSLKSE